MRPAGGAWSEPLYAELVLAAVDDFAPTAAQEHESGFRVFFPSPERRNLARASLVGGPLARMLRATAIEVPDGDWARRSQQSLRPVRVGKIVIAPPWCIDAPAVKEPASPTVAEPCPRPRAAGRAADRLLTSHDSRKVGDAGAAHGQQALTIVIRPSMGFGTGHHQTTQMCLEALQTLDLANAFVLDVGTGSGILAIAASRLGAARALGIDNDPDAIRSASENLQVNQGVGNVAFKVVDLTTTDLPSADVVTANLTGAQLVRAAGSLTGALRRGGTLIVSGLLIEELADVREAFYLLEVVWQCRRGEWAGIAFNRAASPRV